MSVRVATAPASARCLVRRSRWSVRAPAASPRRQAGSDNYNAATDVTQTFGVAKADQSINFTDPTDATFAPAGTVSLTATASSGLDVSFASNSTGVCTVSGSTVTMVGAGTCSITASQAGSDNYNAATAVTQTFGIAKADQSIDFTDPSDTTFAPAGTVGLTATASSGLDVSFASNSSTVCTVSGSTVTMVGAGTCSITASQAGSDNYNAATDVTQTFGVAKADQSIDFTDPSDATFAPAGTVSLTASASSGLDVSFASNDASVCTVSGSTVTMVGAGTCSITASQVGSDNFNGATAVTQTFGIAKADQSIDFTDPTDTTFAPAGTVGLTATASSGLDVSFASNDASVCTVSGSTVTLVGAGTCSITASQAGSDNYNAATDVTQTFGIAKADQSINFTDPSDSAFTPGGNVSLTASATSGLDVSFVSNSTGVCTVSGSTVTTVAAGTCSITASQAGNDNYNAATDVTQTFGIGMADQTIDFTQPDDVTFGVSPVALSGTASSGLDVSFASNSTGICTVSGATATIVAAGTCSITASQAGSDNYNAAVPVTRTFEVGLASQTISFTLPSQVSIEGGTMPLTATATSGLAVAFTSQTPSTCTVSGVSAQLLAAGTCTITAAQVGDGNYSPRRKSMLRRIFKRCPRRLSMCVHQTVRARALTLLVLIWQAWTWRASISPRQFHGRESHWCQLHRREPLRRQFHRRRRTVGCPAECKLDGRQLHGCGPLRRIAEEGGAPGHRLHWGQPPRS